MITADSGAFPEQSLMPEPEWAADRSRHHRGTQDAIALQSQGLADVAAGAVGGEHGHLVDHHQLERPLLADGELAGAGGAQVLLSGLHRVPHLSEQVVALSCEDA
jgi:hypothetical protein